MCVWVCVCHSWTGAKDTLVPVTGRKFPGRKDFYTVIIIMLDDPNSPAAMLHSFKSGWWLFLSAAAYVKAHVHLFVFCIWAKYTCSHVCICVRFTCLCSQGPIHQSISSFFYNSEEKKHQSLDAIYMRRHLLRSLPKT